MNQISKFIDSTLLDLGRQFKLSYLPPLMIYLAAGISGLTGPEVGKFMNGDLSERIGLLLKRPTYKIVFKTPIILSFTELNIQAEINQAPINYLSHGSSSVQTDVRNFKNKLGFKLLKNQINFSFAYDKQIKSPWDPQIESEEIKRASTNTISSSIGLSFRKLPGLNYSIRWHYSYEYLNKIKENGWRGGLRAVLGRGPGMSTGFRA